MKQRIRLFVITAMLGFAASSQAHQIWIEPASEQSLAVRFGEFGDNLREASPGLLDMFSTLSAIQVSGKETKPVTVKKEADGFALPAKLGQGDSIVAEDRAFPLRTYKVDGKEITSWAWFGARYAKSMAAATPELAFDITPTGKHGEFRLTLKGKPLAKAEAQIVVQSGWSKQAHSDEQGLVTFDLPWQGQYVIEASHVDHTPGERAGVKGAEHYDSINYVSTLTVTQAAGIKPVPAGPVMAPHELK